MANRIKSRYITFLRKAELEATPKDPDQAELEAFLERLKQLTSSTLTESDFNALVVSGAYPQTSLGVTLPALPSGFTARIGKTANSAVLTFDVFKGALGGQASSTITQFAADPNEKDTLDLLALLRKQSTTSLTEVDFKKLVIGVALFSQAIATQLGIGTLPSFNGVKVFARKDATEALVHLSMSKGSFGTDGQIDVTKFASPPVDTSVQDQADADNFANQLKSFDTTTLTEANFKAYVKTGAYSQASDSTALGITLPALPSGITATISKPANSAVLSFVVAKNGKTANASSTITKFAPATADPVSPYKADVDESDARFMKLTSTTLSQAAFEAFTITGKPFTQDIADQMGLGKIPLLVPGVTMNMNKKLTGDTYQIQGIKGDYHPVLDVKVTTFGVNPNERDAQAVVDSLKVTSTSLAQDVFTNMTFPAENFTQAVADRLGIGMIPTWDRTKITVYARKPAGLARIAISAQKGNAQVNDYTDLTAFGANTQSVFLIGGGQSNMGLVVDENGYPKSKWEPFPTLDKDVILARADGAMEKISSVGGSYNIAVPYKESGQGVFQHTAIAAAKQLQAKAIYGVSVSHGAAGWAPADDTRNLSQFNLSPRGLYFQPKRLDAWFAASYFPYSIADKSNIDLRYIHIQGEADAGWAGANETNATTWLYLTMSQFYAIQEQLRRFDMVASLGTMKEEWVATSSQAQRVQAKIRSADAYERLAVADNSNVRADTADNLYGNIHFGPLHQMDEVATNLVDATTRALAEPLPTAPIVPVPDAGYVLLDVSKSSNLGAIKDTTFVGLAYHQEAGAISNMRDAWLYRQYETSGAGYYRLKYEFSNGTNTLAVITEQTLNPLMNIWDKHNIVPLFKVISVTDGTGTGFTSANIGISALRNANESTAFAFSAGDINSNAFQLLRTDGNATQGTAVSIDKTKTFDYTTAKVSIVKR